MHTLHEDQHDRKIKENPLQNQNGEKSHLSGWNLDEVLNRHGQPFRLHIFLFSVSSVHSLVSKCTAAL